MGNRNRKLYMVHEDGEEGECLYMERGVFPHERPARPEEITLEAMADMLDLDAEDYNAHEFVPVHGLLAAILGQECDPETATRVMRRLANYSGLHGAMGWGLNGRSLAEKELGVRLDRCPIGREGEPS